MGLKNTPLKVGITGNIGSGKSTVCAIFEQLGIPIYYADQRAKMLMREDPNLVEGIKDLLGQDAYFSDGSINRQFISQQIFTQPELLKKMNQLVHPAVGRDTIQWVAQNAQAPYTLKEAAILFESGSHKQLDKVICVIAPESIRIQRVMDRDQVDEEAVNARMKNQWPEYKKAIRSDFLIYNDGSQSLIDQVMRIHKKLR